MPNRRTRTLRLADHRQCNNILTRVKQTDSCNFERPHLRHVGTVTQNNRIIDCPRFSPSSLLSRANYNTSSGNVKYTQPLPVCSHTSCPQGGGHYKFFIQSEVAPRVSFIHGSKITESERLAFLWAAILLKISSHQHRDQHTLCLVLCRRIFM
jgi:hypothetical protein